MTGDPYHELAARGFIFQVTDEDTASQWLASSPVPFYVGFDPTADSLHVGHLLPIMAMRLLQRAGHVPIAVVGGATALIGDPSGKQEARPIMTREQVTADAGLHVPGRATIDLEQELAPGAYLLVASSRGRTARALVLVSRGALVVKGSRGEGLAWLCDVESGVPVADAALRLWERESGRSGR